MKSFLITFGQLHAHRINRATFDRDSVGRVYAPSEQKAREMVRNWTDNKYHQCIEEGTENKDFMSYFPRGIIDMNERPKDDNKD